MKVGVFTKAQRKALFDLFRRNPDGAKTYREFRGRARYRPLLGCVGIGWCRMFVGIEADGYVHT